jgi:hypothetical protein
MSTSPSQPRSEARKALLAIAALLSSAILHILLTPFAEDDSFIHMRIARSLATRGVPYFDLHVPLSASSSPLWVFVIAPLAWLEHSMPVGIALLNSLIVVGACATVRALVQQIRPNTSRTELITLTSLTAAILFPSSVGLMETPLAVLLFSGGALLLLKGSPWWCVCTLLTIFVRPEMLLYAGALCGVRLCTGLPLQLRELVAGLATLLAILGTYAYYFGLTLPHSIAAKSVVYSLTVQEAVKLLLFALYGEWIARHIVPVSLLIAVVGCAVASWRPQAPRIDSAISSRSLVYGTLVAAIAVLIAYTMRRVFVFPWYTPLFILPIALSAVVAVGNQVLGYRVALWSMLLPVVLKAITVVTGVFIPSTSPMFASGARTMTLSTIGQALYASSPEARILAPEIGALGFAFQGDVIDGVGLTYPAALRFHPLAVPLQRGSGFLGSVPGGLVREVAPEFVVGLPSLLHDAIRTGALDSYVRYSLPIIGGSLLRSERALTVWGNPSVDLYVKGSHMLSPQLKNFLSSNHVSVSEHD